MSNILLEFVLKCKKVPKVVLGLSTRSVELKMGYFVCNMSISTYTSYF